MKIDDVLGTDQTGIVEIAGLEIQGVESAQVPVLGIGVTAGGIRLQSQSWLPRSIPRITGINTPSPRQDRLGSHGPGLHDRLGVPIPLIACAEPACTEGMAALV